jgi:hypothetical protein
MTSEPTGIRRHIFMWGGMALAVLAAAFLLFEGIWFAELRGSAYGIPERQTSMLWWRIAEGGALAGVLACDSLAAVLFARRKRDNQIGTTSILGTSVASSPQWRQVFLGFLLAFVATIILAFVLLLL